MKSFVFVLALALPFVTSAKNSNQGGAQSSLTLSSNLVNKNAAKTGFNASNLEQTNSATSKNNFINFCQGKTLTNGEQVKTGSCNGIVMGDIPSTDNMVTAKFTFPQNTGTITADQTFNISVKVQGMITGNFANANTNYYGAPQQLVGGKITGHTHVVCSEIDSITSTTPTDALGFKFFKGVDLGPDGQGDSIATVTGGLPAGVYRCCCINTSANHAGVLMPVAQRDSVDDCIYFTAKGGNNNGSGAGAGKNQNNGNGNGGNGGGQQKNNGGGQQKSNGGGQQKNNGGGQQQNNGGGQQMSNGDGQQMNNGGGQHHHGGDRDRRQERAQRRQNRRVQ